MLSWLTFFLGLGLGHWLALGRDKRKEFNDKAIELHSKLYDYIKHENNSFLPSNKELDLFASYVPLYKRYRYKYHVKLFDNSVKSDSSSFSYDPRTGVTTIKSGYESQTKKLANKLLKYVERS